MGSVNIITGRDEYLLKKALAYAIAAIEWLPARQQEASDKDGMRRLFEAVCAEHSERDLLMHEAQAHLRPWAPKQERPV